MVQKQPQDQGADSTICRSSVGEKWENTQPPLEGGTEEPVLHKQSIDKH